MIYKHYIGKYYERVMNDGSYCVCRINSFDGKYFRVTEYYLTLGFSTKEINQRKSIKIINAPNFKEISKNRYDIIKFLCIEPFVTIYDENENPYYCREYKNIHRSNNLKIR